MKNTTTTGVIIITALACATILALNGLHVWAGVFVGYFVGYAVIMSNR